MDKRLALLAFSLMLTTASACTQDDPGQAEPQARRHRPVLIGGSPTPKHKDTILSGSLSDIFAQIQDQEPIRRAGLRAGVLKGAQLTVPIVVIVHDADAYLSAIARWEGAVRFPILWDDGTSESHEDIARFVRGFAPDHVFELSGKSDLAWTGDRAKKQRIFERVLGLAVDESKPDWRAGFKAIGENGIISPGIVLSDVNDSAWAGALALCAGRLEPISFVVKPKNTPVRVPMSSQDADAIERAAERAAAATGHGWKEIGDEIDAITLALNTGTMIKTGNGARDRIATSDRIGRRESNGAGARWAWCGQIFGSESRSVYQAMCSLFLAINQGFVWDGYASNPPWSRYDGTEAGELLRKAGFNVEINDQPKFTAHDWKLRMVRPVGTSAVDGGATAGSSSLFLMNSKGLANSFYLPGAIEGDVKPGALPILEVPVALHIVHSFSLQKPSSRSTVGGRFLERGVYAYAGSVDEPGLGGFVPTPAIARRLASSMPFGAAVHYDNAKVWKIAVLGDPLVTIGPGGRRVDGSVAINGGIELRERSKLRLKAGDFLGAIKDLSVLGDDSAVSRLALALMKDQPRRFGPEVARAAIPSLFRSGEYAGLLDAYERLDSTGQADTLMQDMLWLSSPYTLARAASDPSRRTRIVALLRANIRPTQKIRDAENLAMFMRERSVDNAVGVLEALRSTLNKYQVKRLDPAIARVRK